MEKIHTRKSIVQLIIYSCLLSASFIIGANIDLYNEPYFKEINFIDFALWLLLCAAIFFALFFLIKFLYGKSIKIDKPNQTTKKIWLISAVVIFLAWLPYFLMYYPGILTPDSLDSVNQSLGVEELKNYHPVMFTLFVKLILKIGLLFGDLNFAVGCFSIVQMIIMSTIFGYSVYWLSKKGMPKYILVLTSIFYAVNPVVAMYSITMWKDIVFNGFVLLLFLFLIDIIISKGNVLINKKGLAYFSFLSILLAFGRNNGILVVLTTVVILAIYLKAFLKKIVPVFISVLVFILVIQRPVYSALDIEKSPASEALGIPLQQIAYTAKAGGTFTKEQEDFLNKIIPLTKAKEVYIPSIVNAVKFNEEFDKYYLEDNKIRFFKVWAGALPANFSHYTKAYLMQTLGYYHIGTTNWICRYNIVKNQHNLYNTDFIKAAVNVDLKAGVYIFIENVGKIPIVSSIYSIATWVWITFFCCIVLYIKGRRNLLLPLIPLISIWLSLMIGTPAFCEFRYMLSFHYCLPFILMLFFVKNNSIQNALG